ncbi:MAG TPA: AAA family ATPase [Pseudonocardiaceae bacterium]|nr:AAA family ATPase [Pseudonocardiaceae bacterium]
MTGFGRDAFTDAEQQAVLGWATTLLTPDGQYWQLVPRTGWLHWTGYAWQQTMPPMDPYQRMSAQRLPQPGAGTPPAGTPQPGTPQPGTGQQPYSQPSYPQTPAPGLPNYQLTAMPAPDVFARPQSTPQQPAPQQPMPPQPAPQQQPSPQPQPHPAEPTQRLTPGAIAQPSAAEKAPPAVAPPPATAPPATAPAATAPAAVPPATVPPIDAPSPTPTAPKTPPAAPAAQPAQPPPLLPLVPVRKPVALPIPELLDLGDTNKVFLSVGESVRFFIDRAVRVVKWSADMRDDPNRENQPNPILLLVGEPNSGQLMVAKALREALFRADAIPANKLVLDNSFRIAKVGETAKAGETDAVGKKLVEEFVDNCFEKKKVYLIREAERLVFTEDSTGSVLRALTVISKERDTAGVLVLSGTEKFAAAVRAGAPSAIGAPFTYRLPSFAQPEVRAAVVDQLANEGGISLTWPARGRLIDYARECVDAGVATGSDPVLSALELAARAGVVRGSRDPAGRVLVDLPDLGELVSPAQQAGEQAKDQHELVAELDAMIGLEPVKRTVRALLDEIAVDRQRTAGGLKIATRSRHLVFTGNPGTAKTTVARLIAQIYRALGLLSSGHVVECRRADLVGEFIGKTAPKTRALCEKARGGVLFVDEAYELTPRSTNDYGQEAIAELLVQMENHRDDLIVIAAGYPKQMDDFLDANPGLRSRFAHRIEFDDYSNAELARIYALLAGQQGYLLAPDLVTALPERMARVGRGRGFANGRSARGLLEDTIGAQSTRLAGVPNPDRDALNQLLLVDLPAPGDGVGPTDDGGPRRGLAELLAELDGMVGLEPVKQQVRAMTAETRLDARRRATGLAVKGRSRHLVFTGNPGTAKTTVARLVAQIYRELGVLSSGHLVEAGRPDFVGEFVGKTAPKTRSLCEQARGGVLFIDEAYDLAPRSENDYGREAIAELLVQMENHRDDLIVIAAGYPAEMDRFLDANSGLRSRFGASIGFPDYTDAELLRITEVMLVAQGYRTSPELAALLPGAVGRIGRGNGFANGRSVRGLIEKMIERQSIRLAGPEVDLDSLSADELTLLVADDLPAAFAPPPGTEK